MRFAYIDSQGKEVGIPSVEALQLRIELGAIGEETMFFDGNTDRWAPAKEHEIFRTLSLEIEEKVEGGFVAPPPPTMMGGGTKVEEEEPDDDEILPTDFGLELVDDLGPVPASSEGSPEIGAGASERGPEPRDAGSEPVESRPDRVFDLDSLDTLDLEPGAEDEPAPSTEEEAPSAGETEARKLDWGDVEAGDDEGLDSVGEGLELEPGLAEQEPDGALWSDDAASAERVELEDPATAWWRHTPDGDAVASEESPPEGIPPADDLPVAEDLPPAEDLPSAAEEAEVPGGRRKRPTHLRRKRKSSVTRFGVAAIGVVALAAAGWFGWGLLQDDGGRAAGEADVQVPPLPERLQPTYEAVVGPAWAATIDSLRALGSDLPEEPSEEWLSGNYLANASSFEVVQSYWGAIRDYLVRIRREDESIFMTRLENRLDSSGVAPPDREILEERARAGLRAARPRREAVYGQLEDLVRASLDLHDFLVGNEASIDYEPAAAGLSRDPVTEAVPATESLGDRMWDQVAQITTALDNLGALERLSTDRLIGIVLEKLSMTAPS